MVDIQRQTAEIRRGKKERMEKMNLKKKERRKKPQAKNIVACPVIYGGHKKRL